MNDRRVEIGKDIKEVEAKELIYDGTTRTHGQGPGIDTRISIRTATPQDGDGLRAMFSRASSETIYRRFHTPFSKVPEWMLALMLDVDHHGKEFLVAVAEGEIVGHAMYARLGDGAEAEMAIIVEDGWQSKGVGKALLSELARSARLRDIETFIGEVLRENGPMLGLAAAMFAGTRRTMEDGAYHVHMPLGVAGPVANTARNYRRAA